MYITYEYCPQTTEVLTGYPNTLFRTKEQYKSINQL